MDVGGARFFDEIRRDDNAGGRVINKGRKEGRNKVIEIDSKCTTRND
jgi:hypothetical protein